MICAHVPSLYSCACLARDRRQCGACVVKCVHAREILEASRVAGANQIAGITLEKGGRATHRNGVSVSIVHNATTSVYAGVVCERTLSGDVASGAPSSAMIARQVDSSVQLKEEKTRTAAVRPQHVNTCNASVRGS